MKPLVCTLALVGILSSLLRYVVPYDLHVAITSPLFGEYARTQLAVLVAHPVPEALHRLGGVGWMVLGLVQFVPGLRARQPAFHRWAGRIFLLLTLVVAASAVHMAIFFPFELGERAPTFLSSGWMVFSGVQALRFILARDVARHRDWMVRCYAIGLGIGTIRVIAVVLSLGTSIPTRSFYVPAFWGGWLVTAIGAELWLRARGTAGSRTLAAA